MSEILETVVITTDAGPVTINKSDFDPAAHKLVAKAAPAKAAMAAKGGVVDPKALGA